MSYSDSFPTQTPVLNLNFATGSDQFLDSRISFSRADTPPTYSAPSGVHYWSNEKHKSSENLVNQSDGSNWYFSSADYTKTASQTAPDGSSNATKFTEKANGSNQYQVRSNDFTPIANEEITYSVWLKQTSGTRNFQQLRVGNIGANQAFATFNLTNGTVDQTGGTLGVSASVNAGPSGWYQCVMRFTPTSTTAILFYLYAASASGGEIPNVTGDTGNSFTLFGAQASTTGETVVNETSGSIHREYSSTLKSVANAGDPRFEYDPASDGQSEGLLIEAQATNLQRYGSAFASWSNSPNTSISSNAAIAPNGLLEADLVVASSTPASTYVYDNGPSIVSGTNYTASTYIKSSGQRYVQLLGGGSAFPSSQYATFDLQTGSVDANGVTASASSVGNGWYRIQATFVANATSTAGIAVTFVASATSSYLPTFTGNDYDGLLIWGFQLETGSSASSLVDTGTGSSQLSRAADSCSVVDATLFSSGEHTIIWEGDTDPTTNDKRFFALSDGTMSNRFVADYDNGTATRLRNWADSVSNVGMSTSTVDMTVGNHKLAATLKTNEAQLVVDGTRRQADTSCVVGGGIDQIGINSSTTGAGPTYNMNGHCKRLTYYNVALSQTEAEALTSS